MALVAYSDDSDISSDEEISETSETSDAITKVVNESKANPFKHPNEIATGKTSTNIVNGNISSNKNNGSGIDSIVDEDEEEFLTSGSRVNILSSIPAARPLGNFNPNLDVNEDTDMVTDVPTVDTWALLKELKEKNILPNGNESKSSTSTESNAIDSSKEKETLSKEQQLKKKETLIKEQELKKKKITKFIIPSLSEFSDDEEEEKVEPERKKVKASAKGTGLFSLLPEPRGLAVKETKRSLVPHILTKRPQPTAVKKKPKPIKKIDVGGSDSEDDDNGTGDFFSLSTKDADLPMDIGAPLIVASAPKVLVSPEVQPEGKQQPVIATDSQLTNPANIQNNQSYVNSHVQHTHKEEESSGFLPFEEEDSLESSNSSHGLDEETMRRLMGKRGKSEAINFIDVSADDALLTRHEWMTKALSEEKPTHSFSKKKEGLPTKTQKHKHQITYLAHQAKERELELKNNWASNRSSKLQTQAKYGF